MPIRVACACGKKYTFKDEFAGRRAKCPACGQVVQIPDQRVFDAAPPKPATSEVPGEQPPPITNATPSTSVSSRDDNPMHPNRYKISMLSGSFLRSVKGTGLVHFSPDQMRIEQCRVGPSLIPSAITVIPGLFIIFLLKANHADALFWVFIFGVSAAFGIYGYYSKRDNLTIHFENLHHAESDGRTVIMYFRRAPVPGLKRLRFVVSPSDQGRFFTEFALALPGWLKDASRYAASASASTPTPSVLGPTAAVPTMSAFCRLAVWSMILGIASIVLCLTILTGLPAVICGHLALSRIRKSGGTLRGRGMAIAGIVLGYVGITLLIAHILIMILIS